MNLLFILPAIHDLPTGGNVYNRRVIEALGRMDNVEVDVYLVTDDSREAAWLRNHAKFDAVIVDSLLAGIVERPLLSPVSWHLLVHYLTICDPTASAVDKRRLERAVLSDFDGFITTSHYSRNCLQKAGVASDIVRVAYPGLDEGYRNASDPPAQSADTCRMLTVANLLPGKGLLDFVDILEKLAHLPWTWEIIGDGSLDEEYTSALLSRLATSSVSDRILWEGACDEAAMPARYSACDLFVLPSRFETLGMAVREAMACGLPVVAYDVGGVSESLSGSAGRLVHPYHQGQMQAVLEGLIQSPAERHALGERGRRESARFPSWKESARDIITALRSTTL